MSTSEKSPNPQEQNPGPTTKRLTGGSKQTGEVLEYYSNLGDSDMPVLALIAEAEKFKAPKETRNRRALQQRVRRLAAAEAKGLIVAYHAGDSMYKVGHRFSISHQTVSEHLRRAGIETRGKKRITLTEEQQEEVRRLQT